MNKLLLYKSSFANMEWTTQIRMDSGQWLLLCTLKPSQSFSHSEDFHLLSIRPTQTTWGGIIITNHGREEDIAMQRYPLNSAILAKLGTIAASSRSEGSKQNLIFDVTCLGRFIGPWVSEYSQTSSNKVDYHIYPSGNKVIKAFTAERAILIDN